MNKEELLKHIDSQQPIVTVRDREVSVEELKPVVPQFVADWYEEHKDNLEYSIKCLSVHGCLPVRKIDTWFDNEDNKSIETLVMMHKFGYIVKKEKLYTVEIPNPNTAGGKIVLLRQDTTGKLILNMFHNSINMPTYLYLTEQEIKQDFEWAWQFAKEVKE